MLDVGPRIAGVQRPLLLYGAREGGIDDGLVQAAEVAEARHAVEAMDLFVQMTHAGVILRLDQDSARARWTLNEIGRLKADQRALLGGVDGMNILATYTDELVREADGRWRFARRTYRVALFDGHAPAGDVVTAAPASA